MDNEEHYSVTADTARVHAPTIVILVAMLVGVLAVKLGIWVFEPTELAEREFRSAIIRNFGLMAVGVIGLPLAIWRGYTAHKQANEAIRQGLRTEQQLKLTADQLKTIEDSSNADVLQKAASMMKSTYESDLMTSATLLISIGSESRSRFSQTANGMLVQMLNGKSLVRGEPEYIRLILEYIHSISGENYFPEIIDFTIIGDGTSINSYNKYYEYLNYINYKNFYFVNKHFPRGLWVSTNTFTHCEFEKCKIEPVIFIDTNTKFDGCEIGFLPLSFREKKPTAFISNCDVSGLLTANTGSLRCDYDFKDCFYLEDRKPEIGVMEAHGEYFTALPANEYNSRLKDIHKHPIFA